MLGIWLLLGLPGTVPAQTDKPKCGPDHAILYKRAVGLLDQAEKKLNAKYTAEAKSLVKEANSLFTILQKECGPEQKDRVLTDKETQQEAINQKLAADERSAADRLMQGAEDKEKKAQQLEASQPDVSVKYQREAKQEYEQAHKRYIKAGIYALRNQQMVFSFLGR
jgi:DNA anti-recombination protein RmuC